MRAAGVVNLGEGGYARENQNGLNLLSADCPADGRSSPISVSKKGGGNSMKGRIALLAAIVGLFALVAAPLAGAKKPAPGSGPGNSGAAHKCQKGGYLSLVGADGTTFKNVGACVSFAAHGGQFATGLVIPAGKKATLSNAQFGDFFPTAPLAPNTWTNCPGDPLAYGYQLNLGANVQVATGGMGCQAVAGAVIGPFPTAVLLRIFLTDNHPPVFTFYSDGNHATVVGSNPYLVSIRDSVFGTITTAPLIPPPGDGNLNVVVTIA
jgi:hypothetical protein